MLAAITEFPLPSATSGPGALTVGPDGDLWFSDGAEIGRITPTGSVTEFPLPTAAPYAGLTVGPDGDLWFSEGSAGIGRITPSGAVTTFPLPDAQGGSGDLTVGPDGDLWFGVWTPSLVAPASIGRITPSGAVTEFPLLSALFTPGALVVGPDGNLWFPEASVENSPFNPVVTKLGRITPSGAVTEFPVGVRGALTVGPDGDLWFPAGPAGIGRIAPSGAVTEFALPVVDPRLTFGPLMPGALTVGPDGNLWFGASSREGPPGWIGRVTPSGAVTVFPLPSAGDLSVGGAPTVGPDGNLWFVGVSGDGQPDSLVRVTPAGLITDFAISTASPFQIGAGLTVGPDGDLWFPEDSAGAIGRVDPSALRGTGVVAIKHSGARITAIVLGFDQALDPRTARKRSSYSLAVGMIKRRSGFSWHGVKIGGVSYHSTTNTVRLKMVSPRKGPLEVTVRIGSMAAGGVPSLGDFIAVVP